LLDDPETARYHLRSNLDDVRESAIECKQEAEKIKAKFEYLVDFIAALQEATIETKSKSGFDVSETLSDRMRLLTPGQTIPWRKRRRKKQKQLE
jgi:hypothetical protein